MRMNDFLNAGNIIMSDIEKAIINNDFSHLEQDISRAVNEATAHVFSNRAEVSRSNFSVKKISRHTGSLRIIFGKMGIIFNGIMLAGSIALLHANRSAGAIGIIFFGFFFALAFKIERNGKSDKELVNAYYNYGRILGNAEYFNISDLASMVRIPESRLRQQLSAMRNKGYLLYAVYDDTGKTMILTDHAYKQYLEAKRAWEEYRNDNYSPGQDTGFDKTKDERADRSEKENNSEQNTENYSPEVRHAIETGKQYIRHIRKVNDMIPDTEEMSNKLYVLESITNRIFDRMKKHPESVPELKKFMEYYLPTTQKLMDYYVELYNQPEAGKNIREAKKEIENSFDMVNKAYEKLLDEMFEDTAWDVSSDISVMKTMMQQDGLSDEGQIRK